MHYGWVDYAPSKYMKAGYWIPLGADCPDWHRSPLLAVEGWWTTGQFGKLLEAIEICRAEFQAYVSAEWEVPFPHSCPAWKFGVAFSWLCLDLISRCVKEADTKCEREDLRTLRHSNKALRVHALYHWVRICTATKAKFPIRHQHRESWLILINTMTVAQI